MKNTFELKDALTIAPVVWAILAILFDVGYFWGIDINFFNSFSFTEHLVFAAQAAPHALAMLIIAIVTGYLGVYLGVKFASNVDKGAAPDGLVNQKFQKRMRNLNAAYFLYNICACGVLYYSVSYRLLIVYAYFAVTSTLMFFFALNRAVILGTFGFIIVSGCMLGAILFGHYNAREYLALDKYAYRIIFKDGRNTLVKLIRFGDRGVLVQDQETDALMLHARENIQSIAKI